MKFKMAARLLELAERVGCPALLRPEDLDSEMYVVCVEYEGTWQRITGKTLVADVKFLEKELDNV